jgi:hypothetical protein
MPDSVDLIMYIKHSHTGDSVLYDAIFSTREEYNLISEAQFIRSGHEIDCTNQPTLYGRKGEMIKTLGKVHFQFRLDQDDEDHNHDFWVVCGSTERVQLGCEFSIRARVM